MVALQARRNAFESMMRNSQPNASNVAATVSGEVASNSSERQEVKWSAGDARQLEEVVEKTRRGMLFLSLK